MEGGSGRGSSHRQLTAATEAQVRGDGAAGDGARRQGQGLNVLPVTRTPVWSHRTRRENSGGPCPGIPHLAPQKAPSSPTLPSRLPALACRDTTPHRPPARPLPGGHLEGPAVLWH